MENIFYKITIMDFNDNQEKRFQENGEFVGEWTLFDQYSILLASAFLVSHAIHRRFESVAFKFKFSPVLFKVFIESSSLVGQ